MDLGEGLMFIAPFMAGYITSYQLGIQRMAIDLKSQ